MPKQSEKVPRESEAKFRLLFEKSTDAMLLLDGDVFVDCNQAAVEMMGCSSKEQLLVFHPDDISPERQPDGQLSSERARDLIATALREGSLRFEWVHRAVDGTDFPVEVLLTAISLYGRKLLHVVWRDISERKRAEEALRESETNLRSLLENATNFVVYRVAIDASTLYEGQVVMVSPSIKEIAGISDPYRFESWFESIHPQDLPRVMEANRRAWEMGETYSQSVRVYHPQKEQWIWLHTASTPVFDAEGKLTHFNGLIIDITAQKQAEEALQAAYQTLELRVEERTREIERRRQVAEGLRDAVTQTLFSASLIAEALPRLWERDPQEGHRRLDELRELTRGALAEMRSLLLELRPSAFVDAPLGDLLRQLGESITGRARVPVTVEVEGECSLPAEVKVALYRIAQEALNNVAKHAGASQASVSLRCQAEQVVLCVSDDGRGFDPDSIPLDSLGTC